MNPDIISFIGYAASFFVVLSFMLKDLKKIRIINLIGCVCFVLWGALLSPMLWPVIIPNSILFGIQIYFLTKKEKK